ncbi:MAG: 4Fe-4S dicluster domain-containing protein [Anaerolineae bacterium]
MAFKFTVDRSGCINCGICMDVCPVQALDMTRPNRAGPEGTDFGGETEPHRWIMQYPVQVSRCIGCLACQRECPVEVIAIQKAGKEPRYTPRQGPVIQVPKGEEGWVPLSTLTKESLKKPVDRGPWGEVLPRWRSRDRRFPWQVWRRMGEEEEGLC